MSIAQGSGERMSSAEQRRLMVDRQVRTYDVTDQIVIARMLDVPRENFVEPGQAALAYSDGPLALSGDAGPAARTLLPPFVIARMLQGAAPQQSERALDVASGSGYTAALLSGLVHEVVAVEPDGALFARAKKNFAELGLHNVTALGIPMAKLLPDLGPFDVIVVNGCAQDGLAALAALLAPGGRIVAIVPKLSGATMAALVTGRGTDLSVRPLFDAQAPVLAEFRRAPAFVL